jgi:hypothetical protein
MRSGQRCIDNGRFFALIVGSQTQQLRLKLAVNRLQTTLYTSHGSTDAAERRKWRVCSNVSNVSGYAVNDAIPHNSCGDFVREKLSIQQDRRWNDKLRMEG